MNIKVNRFNRNMSEEYINFFDNRAFSDRNAEKGCYCVWHHWTDKHKYERSLMPENERSYHKRDYAKELIQNGILNGFVAFYDNQMKSLIFRMVLLQERKLKKQMSSNTTFHLLVG